MRFRILGNFYSFTLGECEVKWNEVDQVETQE